MSRLKKLQLKQKRELQSVVADRERQRIRLGMLNIVACACTAFSSVLFFKCASSQLISSRSCVCVTNCFPSERRGDQLQHAAERLRETRMELVALLQKKNKVSRRRNASMRHHDVSRRSTSAKAAAREAKSLQLEEEAKESFRAHAVHSKLVLLQQEIMRRAAIQTKEEELERELEKRQQLLLQLTNLVGARQQLAEDGLGDLTEAGAPPATQEEQDEALSVELAAIDSKIEGCEMKIAAVTGTLQECAAELKVLNSELRNGISKSAAAKQAEEDEANGIDPVARTVLDKDTTSEEAQYMLSQLISLVRQLSAVACQDSDVQFSVFWCWLALTG